MQTYQIRFHMFDANGFRGNVMSQNITASSPSVALEQLRKMYGRVDVINWTPV